MLRIGGCTVLREQEIVFSAVRAQGPGGQNVNKVATAVQLSFDIGASSLPPEFKARLLAHPDRRISKHGVLVIKAQRYRSQEKNREDALQRLAVLLREVATVPRIRKATKPTRAAQQRRLDAKTRRGRLKALRGQGGASRSSET